VPGCPCFLSGLPGRFPSTHSAHPSFPLFCCLYCLHWSIPVWLYGFHPVALFWTLVLAGSPGFTVTRTLLHRTLLRRGYRVTTGCGCSCPVHVSGFGSPSIARFTCGFLFFFSWFFPRLFLFGAGFWFGGFAVRTSSAHFPQCAGLLFLIMCVAGTLPHCAAHARYTARTPHPFCTAVATPRCSCARVTCLVCTLVLPGSFYGLFHLFSRLSQCRTCLYSFLYILPSVLLPADLYISFTACGSRISRLHARLPYACSWLCRWSSSVPGWFWLRRLPFTHAPSPRCFPYAFVPSPTAGCLVLALVLLPWFGFGFCICAPRVPFHQNTLPLGPTLVLPAYLFISVLCCLRGDLLSPTLQIRLIYHAVLTTSLVAYALPLWLRFPARLPPLPVVFGTVAFLRVRRTAGLAVGI